MIAKLFRCTFLQNEKDEGEDCQWLPIRCIDAQEAAEIYASREWDDGMWEVTPPWTEDYSVVVLDPDGKREVFDIEIDFDPSFSARRPRTKREEGNQ